MPPIEPTVMKLPPPRAAIPGRVIAALSTDPDLMNLTGGTFITAELAQRYGITDIDGRTIPSLRAERGSPIWAPITEAGHGR